MPELSQLRNYIAKVKAKKGPVGKITMNQLKDACQKYLEVPADIDQAFIIGSEFDDSDMNDPLIEY
jgi:hypothetical protein